MSTLLEVKHLKKHFPSERNFWESKRTPVYAVNDVSLTVNRCETLGVVGESGCGKSTLGRSILRLTEPTEGEILFDNTDVRKLSAKELRQFRKRMQMIFQDPTATLDPRWTIEQALMESLRTHDKEGKGSTAWQEEISHLLSIVGLPEHHRSKYPHELSGGQRQRIAIAKAISVKPDFIVADEPVSALDVSVQAQVLNLMQKLKEERSLSYLFITHDLSVVKFISDRICVMYLGRIVELTDTKEFFTSPLHPYSHMLLESIPDIDPSRRGMRKQVLNDKGLERSLLGCAFRNRCSKCTEICRNQVPELKEVMPGHFVACHEVS